MLGAPPVAQPAPTSAEQAASHKGELEWHASDAITFGAGLPSALDGLSINGHTGLQQL